MKSPHTRELCRAIAWVGLAALTLSVAPPAWAAWPSDPMVNVRLAPFAADQVPYSIVSDGAGGGIVVWRDSRSGNYDIYAQRVTASGAIAPGWPATGLAVCTATGDQNTPVAAPDGAGGAVIAWADERAGVGLGDIYAMRVNANGTLHPSWPVNGRNLSILSPANNELGPDIVSDGNGGAIVAWTFVFTSFVDWDLYAAHVSPLGVNLWEVAVSAPSGFQYPARLCTDGAGGAIAAFADNVTGDYEIRAARIRGSDGFLPWGIKDACVFSGAQTEPVIASDGSGGAVIAWQDPRNGSNTDLFAQHLNASGNPVPGWFATGNAVCATSGDQYQQSIISDGAQGAILAWTDGRYGTNATFALRISGGGAPYPGWPVNGVAVTTINSSFAPALASDGTGGAIVTWTDGVASDLYASRLTATGVLAPGWTTGGTVISAAAATQSFPHIMSDGTGGAIMTWIDGRFGVSAAAAFAQRVDLFGQLGSAEPTITRIKDVPGDQGGHVRLDWSASYLDVNPTFGVGNYWIWRQAPVDAALRAVRGGAMSLNDGGGAVLGGDPTAIANTSRGLYMFTTVDATVYAWEFIASQPASGFPKYSYIAATTRDSLGGSNPYTPFMVQARATSGGAFWSSAPDSGYSADNLGPAVPQPFTGALTGGGDMHLHWGPNSESDLAGYRLYRGSSAGFVPSPANLVSAQPDTGYVDPGTGPHYYKLSAVDVHGNESGFALLAPSGTLDVATDRVLALALARPAPNPARGASRIDFALPHETRVSLAVLDVAGRAVRRIFDGVLPAGEHTQRWDLRDASGSTVRAGLYFVRLEADGRGLSQRLVVSGE